jgi:hypothetical protein
MSDAGSKRVANGELAVICACALLSRIDQQDARHQILIDRALLIERRLPAEAALMSCARFTALVFALNDYIAACADVVRGPTGERDWRPVYDAQAGLRMAVDRCLASLGDRCFGVWSGGGHALAPRPGGAETIGGAR